MHSAGEEEWMDSVARVADCMSVLTALFSKNLQIQITIKRGLNKECRGAQKSTHFAGELLGSLIRPEDSVQNNH